jgi:hypothetical protein
MRINARLYDSYEEKFHLVSLINNKNRTEVLKEALDMYFAKLLENKKRNAWEKNQKILAMIAGIVSGPEDGSVNYKKYVAEYLDDKFPNH